tara:strand:- start:5782 stop:7527 length:1746 start_codon:yes stop_codon:yes gene_type:complete
MLLNHRYITKDMVPKVAVLVTFVAISLFMIYAKRVQDQGSISLQARAFSTAIASEAAEDIAIRILDSSTTAIDALNIPISESVDGITLLGAEGEIVGHKDFPRSQLVRDRSLPPVKIELNKFGADSYSVIVFTNDKAHAGITRRTLFAWQCMLVLSSLSLLVYLLLRHQAEPRRKDQAELGVVASKQSQAESVIRQNKDTNLRRYMTILSLRKLKGTADHIVASIDATVHSLNQNDSLMARKILADEKAKIVSAAKILDEVLVVNSKTPRSDEKMFTWMSASKIFSDLSEGLQYCADETLNAKFSIMYAGGAEDQLLIDADVVPLVISAALGAIEEYVVSGTIYVKGSIEKDLLIVQVEVETEREEHDGSNILNAYDGALGEGIKFVFNLAKSIGASVTVDSVENQAVRFRLILSVKTRIGFDIPDSNVAAINVEHEQRRFATFFHNYGDGGIKILVVDNDVNRMQNIADKMSLGEMRRDDVRVTFTSDPAEAVRQVEEVLYDAVVVRHGMRNLDALLFFKVLGQTEHNYSGSRKFLMAESGAVSEQRMQIMNQMGVTLIDQHVSVVDIKNVVRNISLRAV